MDVIEAIAQRRTVHMYRDSEIDPVILEQALEAALLAPNHKFTFPWKFVVVGDETRKKLVGLAKQMKMKEGMTPEQEATLEQKLQHKMLHPAALVAFCSRRSDDAFRQREDYATVSCSIQNFTLALAGHGYGTKWSTGGITTAPQTYEWLEVDPAAYDIIGFVWVGHAAAPLPEQRRPALQEVLQKVP